MTEYSEQKLMMALAELAAHNGPIDQKLYKEYDVRRGLRYADGRGVLVDLTRIGDVIGYTMVDGKKKASPGKLLYRGYDLKDLVDDAQKNKQFGFEQTVYLLLFGELPTADQLSLFRLYLGVNRTLPESFTEDMIMKAPSQNIMNKLARGVLASYSYDRNPEDRTVENNLRQCIELISRFSTLVAYAYQAKRRYFDEKSMYIHNPKPELSTAENILRLIRQNKHYSRLEAEILDLSLILHAEHGGGNNSSLAVHVVSSADTDTYSAIAAAIGSLKGYRHGGASLKVIEQMDEIKAHVKDWSNESAVKNYLRKILKKEAGDGTGLVYGQGHAIYTISDPRAVLLRDKAQELAKDKGCTEEFELYTLIERVFPDVFYEHKGNGKRICSNVDFYSGLVYSMLTIPRDLFTPLFAVSRIAGWCAHRIEEISSGGRIYRPAYKNIAPERTYIPMHERS
ncbi:MAG TPA: citrate/2-methylcitrate synthase [Treponemataceae bacterium]|nr:citrate/2-methylcitrate synthase [Treponemataceae bacterium]